MMKLTWFDANSWLIEAAGWRILVDPWLVGDLVFGNSPWLVKGIRQTAEGVARTRTATLPTNIDLILLSQGLADHAHPETLSQLDKTIPVIASPDGARVAQDSGFHQVAVAAHGSVLSLGGSNPQQAPNNRPDNKPDNRPDNWPNNWPSPLEIRTLEGAVVGPMKRENGYVLTFLETGQRLYYEPHGYPDLPRLEAVGTVDVVITPLADITLLGLAPVVRGGEVAQTVANLLRPQVMLPTAEAGRVDYEGLIAPALKTTGGAQTMRSRLAAADLEIEVIQPVPEEPIELALNRPVSSL